MKCKSCGAEIFFAINIKTEKKIPLDAKPVRLFSTFLRSDGEMLCETIEGHQTHFVTCPNADHHRKIRKKD